MEDTLLFNGHYTFSDNFYALNMKNGSIIWQKHLSEILTEDQREGIDEYKASNLFTCAGHTFLQINNRYLCAINYESGELIWSREANPFLIPFQDKIYGLSRSHYNIYNSSGDSLLTREIREDLKRISVLSPMGNYVISGKKLFFNIGIESKIGVVELSSGRIISSYDYPIKEGTTFYPHHPPIVTEDRIYQLDSSGTIHMLLKEELFSKENLLTSY